MSTASSIHDPAPRPGVSARVAFAAAAREAVLAEPGVVALDPAAPGSGLHETVPGVTVLPGTGGAYRVRVRLAAAVVPLPDLAARVRRAVQGCGYMLGGVPVGPVDVTVESIVDLTPTAT